MIVPSSTEAENVTEVARRVSVAPEDFVGGAKRVALMSNFVLNNLRTYRDSRLREWEVLRGWLSFAAASCVGALANVGVANPLFERAQFWLVSAMPGILVGAVWPSAVTAMHTWRWRSA